MQQDYILEFFEMLDSRIQVWESCLKSPLSMRPLKQRAKRYTTQIRQKNTFFVNGPVTRFLDSESIRRYR